ncbi:MAG: hypothetical protein IGS39_08450 [Calothrix sp. C42_A2020_038]|nr:hypothetical protein [Calothrix sp. C42_A2020_038]
MLHKFYAADEQENIVYGAAKPDYSNQQVDNWIKFMKDQDIKRICCLQE